MDYLPGEKPSISVWVGKMVAAKPLPQWHQWHLFPQAVDLLSEWFVFLKSKIHNCRIREGDIVMITGRAYTNCQTPGLCGGRENEFHSNSEGTTPFFFRGKLSTANPGTAGHDEAVPVNSQRPFSPTFRISRHRVKTNHRVVSTGRLTQRNTTMLRWSTTYHSLQFDFFRLICSSTSSHVHCK